MKDGSPEGLTDATRICSEVVTTLQAVVKEVKSHKQAENESNEVKTSPEYFVKQLHFIEKNENDVQLSDVIFSLCHELVHMSDNNPGAQSLLIVSLQ